MDDLVYDFQKKSYLSPMILVTGGTGLVGAHLLLHLTQKGFHVRAIHRKTSNLKRVKEVFGYFTQGHDALWQKITWVEADITHLPALELAFQGITQVYHCAAFISFQTSDYQKLKSINIQGTANVVNLCLANNVDYLCHVSSIATLGSTLDGSAVHEDTHWNSEENNNVYAISKYGAEMHVWRGIQEGLHAVIINPGVILGEGNWDSGSGPIFKKAAKGMNYYTSGGTGFIDVKDVVQIMVALTEMKTTNERFVLVGHNTLYAELLNLLALSFSKPTPKRKLGKRTLTWLRYLDGFVSSIFFRKRRLNKEAVNSLTSVSTYDSSKIIALLDYTFVPLQETVERVAKTYSSSS